MITLDVETLKVMIYLYLTTREKKFGIEHDSKIIDKFYDEMWDLYVDDMPDYYYESYLTDEVSSEQIRECYAMFRRFCYWSGIPGFDRCCIDSERDEYFYLEDIGKFTNWYNLLNNCDLLQLITLMMIMFYIRQRYC